MVKCVCASCFTIKMAYLVNAVTCRLGFPLHLRLKWFSARIQRLTLNFVFIGRLSVGLIRMVRKGACAQSSSKRGPQTSRLKRLSLLDPGAPEPPPLQIDPADPDDRIYLRAAAIFQNTHLQKPAAQRLISFGNRSEVSVPEVRGEASQRLAYQLAFNTLKCKCQTCFPH